VAARTLLLKSVLLLVVLGMNVAADRQHERAFSEGSMTPLPAVMPDWREQLQILQIRELLALK
jgi:hypothetical protein